MAGVPTTFTLLGIGRSALPCTFHCSALRLDAPSHRPDLRRGGFTGTQRPACDGCLRPARRLFRRGLSRHSGSSFRVLNVRMLRIETNSLIASLQSETVACALGLFCCPPPMLVAAWESPCSARRSRPLRRQQALASATLAIVVKSCTRCPHRSSRMVASTSGHASKTPAANRSVARSLTGFCTYSGGSPLLATQKPAWENCRRVWCGLQILAPARTLSRTLS